MLLTSKIPSSTINLTWFWPSGTACYIYSAPFRDSNYYRTFNLLPTSVHQHIKMPSPHANSYFLVWRFRRTTFSSMHVSLFRTTRLFQLQFLQSGLLPLADLLDRFRVQNVRPLLTQRFCCAFARPPRSHAVLATRKPVPN